MGTLATAQPCGNVEEFARACGVANHPFLQLLLMAWSMRGRQVRGQQWEDVEAALARPHRPRWVQLLLQSAFGLYCVARHRAAPRGGHPTMPVSGVVPPSPHAGPPQPGWLWCLRLPQPGDTVAAGRPLLR